MAVLLMAALVLDQAAAGEFRLPDDPMRLRYGFRDASVPSLTEVYFAASDLDGDGIDEQIKYGLSGDGVGHRLIVRLTREIRRTLDQESFPLSAGIAGVTDVDGDGRAEIIAWHQTETGTAELRVIGVTIDEEGMQEEILGTLVWDVSPWILPNGIWSGEALLGAAFDRDGNGTREALVLGVNSGHSHEPRGLWLGNWETSEFEWQVPTGGTPTGGMVTADLTGDGRQEIVLGLESPGNGIATERWDDSHAYVVVLGLDGEVVWDQELSGYSTMVKLTVADLDGDGRSEVVTAVGEYAEKRAGRAGVSVWRGRDGELVAWCPFENAATGVVSLETRDGVRLYASGADGIIRRLRLEQGILAVEDEVYCGDPVTSITSAKFEPTLKGESILALLASGGLVLLDDHLRPLALMRTADTGTAACRWFTTAVFEVAGDRVRGGLVQTGMTLRYLYLARNPIRPEIKVLVATVAALAVAACFPAARSTAIAGLRRAVLPKAGRGPLVDELLSSLKTATHGRLAVTATFRRLREQAAMIASLEKSPDAFAERFSDAVSNIRQIGILGLRDVLRQAEQLGLAPLPVAALRGTMREIERIVEALPEALPDPEQAKRLRHRLDAVLPSVDAELLEIRRAAEREHSCRLVIELRRVLRSRQAEFVKLGVHVTERGMEPAEDVLVLGTAFEVSFVLENLLANAIDAVGAGQKRSIELTVTTGETHAVVTIVDTGVGIPEAAHESVFRPGVSDREGGGHGLHRSRELLDRRGGSINLVRSSPGEGAAFEVRFRLCC